MNKSEAIERKTMNKSDVIDQQYLLGEQYKDACNFNTRLRMIQNLGKEPVDWYPWIFSQIKKTPGSRVLELGCGPGHLWQENLKLIPPDWDITLSDFSPGMLKDTQSTLDHHGRPFTFQVIDAQEIPFEDASFDILIANLVLYHVPDRARAFSEIRRVLKPGGIFYAGTVTEAALTDLEPLTSAAGMPSGDNVLSFSLENGERQLTPWFSHVACQRLDTTLAITKVEPLVTYIRSTTPQCQSSETKFQRLREIIQQELSRNGEIHLHMDIALFGSSNIPF
jgi:ubiquinone/menaquinone biosynthesis C-methylase UbiE